MKKHTFDRRNNPTGARGNEIEIDIEASDLFKYEEMLFKNEMIVLPTGKYYPTEYYHKTINHRRATVYFSRHSDAHISLAKTPNGWQIRGKER